MTTLLIWSLLALFALAAIFFGLWRASKASRERDRRKGVMKALKAKDKAVDAMVNGLEKEEEVRNEKVDTSDRAGPGRM